MVLDWKTLFIRGRPLYEEDVGVSHPLHQGSSIVTTMTTSSDVLRQQVTNDQLLNDSDFHEYNVIETSIPVGMGTVMTYIIMYFAITEWSE